MTDRDEFTEAVEEVVKRDAEKMGSVPLAFLHGEIDDTGGILTLTVSRSPDVGYDEKIAILARLLAEVEIESDQSTEDVFRDLVEARNQMGGDES